MPKTQGRDKTNDVTPVTEETVRKDGQGYWVGETKSPQYGAEIGSGHVYKIETVWLAFVAISRF